jgi:hypothetical protein
MVQLTPRAASLLPKWAVLDNVPDGIRALAMYAAKRPGLDFRDYCSDYRDINGRAAYFSEARAISKQLDDVREALAAAYAQGVTDADLIECSRGGRLTLGADLSIDYTIGQYWPTEYRAAVARLAASAARVAKYRTLATL